MSEWIKCSERMPYDGQRVLCWLRSISPQYPNHLILHFKLEKQSESHSHFPPIRDDLITHWMALPEPPEDV